MAIPPRPLPGSAVSGGRISGFRHQLRAPRTARFAGLPQSKLFMCPCHGGAYYETAPRARVHRSAASSSILQVASNFPNDPRRRNAHARHQASCSKPSPLTQIVPATNSARRSHQWPAKETPPCRRPNRTTGSSRRLALQPLYRCATSHPTPGKQRKLVVCLRQRRYRLLRLQVVTGILLALVYIPSATEAWTSLFLNHDIALGWFLRALHGWGSDFMVAIVLIHMVQVFLFGAYKFPRELTWIVGVFLFC